jgi:hypothetical protein
MTRPASQTADAGGSGAEAGNREAATRTTTARAGAPGPLLAMIDALEPEAMREVALLLDTRLTPLVSAEERRFRELGFLAEILDVPDARDPRSPRTTPTRYYYDEHKPPGAPQAQRLCERYGSWTKACRAARGLIGTEPGARAWTHGFTGKRKPPKYTRDEVIRAVLKCAAMIGRIPSSHAYYTWAARERGRAKQTGKTVRYPAQRSVERFFKSWSAVRQAAEAPLVSESLMDWTVRSSQQAS